MIHTTEAIVLRSRIFREADQMVTLLTPHVGKVTGLARHAKKSQKRFGPVLQPFNILEVHYRERAPSSLIFLERASMKIPLIHLGRHFHSIVGAYYCVELMSELVHEHDPNLKKYQLLLETLMRMELISRGEDAETMASLSSLLRWYEYRLLTLAGIGPELKRCVKCREDVQGSSLYQFVYWEGGAVCPRCMTKVSGKMGDPIGGDLLLSFGHFVEGFSQGKDHSLEKKARGPLRNILHNFIHYQLNKVLKSQVFIDSLAHTGSKGLLSSQRTSPATI